MRFIDSTGTGDMCTERHGPHLYFQLIFPSICPFGDSFPLDRDSKQKSIFSIPANFLISSPCPAQERG